MVRQNVAGAQHGEEVGDLGGDAAQARLRRGRPHLFLEVWTVELREGGEAAHVEQAVDLIDVGRLELELAREQVQHLRRHAGIDLEPHHARVTAPAAQLGLDRGQQVLGVAVDVVEISITRDAERMMSHDLHPGEKQRKVKCDHVLQRDVALTLDERNETRQDRWDFDARESRLPALWIAHPNCKV